ncbi:MAG TPA: DUF4384 domain-containing protein, partial [Longimicrobiaceae bacterium]|nr:DUF4384 domain-containing protein [Longimicrobiaceae bacterium]
VVGAGPPPAAGSDAELVAAGQPEALLRVSLQGLPAGTAAALRGAGISHVAVQEDARLPAHLVVRAEPGGGWAVTGPDGALRHRVNDPGPAAAGELVALFRREQAALTLASLENPGHPFPLDFGFAGGGTTFRLGQTVELRARAGRAGYLTLVDIDPAGKVTVLFPNRFDGANRVEAGEEVVIPTPAMNFAFRVQEPEGRGVVRAFLTERPLPLDFATGDGGEAAEAVARALRQAAGPPPVPGSTAVPVGSWATAYVVYEFVR